MKIKPVDGRMEKPRKKFCSFDGKEVFRWVFRLDHKEKKNHFCSLDKMFPSFCFQCPQFDRPE